jgi:hypothetical protein
MNVQLNNLFNTARKVLGEAAVIEIIKATDAKFQTTTIKGFGHSRAQLGLSSKNISWIMRYSRYVKVSTGIGSNNFKIMFPFEFAGSLKNALLRACSDKTPREPASAQALMAYSRKIGLG